MSEKEERQSIEQYFIDYKKCWYELRQFHEHMEMLAESRGDLFKVTDMMNKIEKKYKVKMIAQ